MLAFWWVIVGFGLGWFFRTIKAQMDTVADRYSDTKTIKEYESVLEKRVAVDEKQRELINKLLDAKFGNTGKEAFLKEEALEFQRQHERTLSLLN